MFPVTTVGRGWSSKDLRENLPRLAHIVEYHIGSWFKNNKNPRLIFHDISRFPFSIKGTFSFGSSSSFFGVHLLISLALFDLDVAHGTYNHCICKPGEIRHILHPGLLNSKLQAISVYMSKVAKCKVQEIILISRNLQRTPKLRFFQWPSKGNQSIFWSLFGTQQPYESKVYSFPLQNSRFNVKWRPFLSLRSGQTKYYDGRRSEVVFWWICVIFDDAWMIYLDDGWYLAGIWWWYTHE